MAPPELAADVPVAHLREPVLPDLDEAFRQDLRLAGSSGVESSLGQRRHADEPLRLEARLHDIVGTLAVPDQRHVRFDRIQVAARLEGGHDLAASFVAIQARKLRPVLVDARGVVQDRDHRQAVALAGVVVVLVVGRSDLDRTRPECPIHHGVGDDRDGSIHERDHGPAADQRGVARVFGIDCHGGIAEKGLRASGRDRDPRVGIRGARGLVDEVVAQRPEAALGLGRDHFQVRDARPAAGAPVDQRLCAVRKALAVEAQECLAHGSG